MNGLGDVQGRFFNGVVHKDTNAESLIVQQGVLSNAERLAIYSEGYRLRLLEALGDSYPAVHTLIGDEAFDLLGRAYIDAHPSTHFSIRYFGHRLASFIEGYSELGASERALVAEMALFEWSLRAAFDAEDHTPISLAQLAEISPDTWPNLRFTLAPSLQRLSLHWNTATLWMAIDTEQAPQAPQALADPERWIIWRPDLQTRFRSLTSDETVALDALQQGCNFAEICSELGTETDDTAQRAANYLQTWFSENLIAAVQFA